MKKVFIFFVLVNLLYGGLVPVPFITYPEPIQRVGYGYTKKYFKKYLFKTPYGIAMTKLRNNAGLFIIISDKGWNRVLYTLVKGNECDWIRELKKWETPLGTDEFNMPTGLCIDTTIYQNNPDKYTIYVVDYNRVVILKYTVSEEKLRYSCIFPFNFYSPIDVACITKEDGKGSYIGIVEKDGRKFEIFESNPQQIYQLLYECDKFGYINFISPSSISIAKASYGEG